MERIAAHIANDQGNRITPSYVAWNDSGERLIAAKNQQSTQNDFNRTKEFVEKSNELNVLATIIN